MEEQTEMLQLLEGEAAREGARLAQALAKAASDTWDSRGARTLPPGDCLPFLP